MVDVQGVVVAAESGFCAEIGGDGWISLRKATCMVSRI